MNFYENLYCLLIGRIVVHFLLTELVDWFCRVFFVFSLFAWIVLENQIHHEWIRFPQNADVKPSGGQAAREGKHWTHSGGGAITELCRTCQYDWQRNHDRNEIKGKQLLLKRAVSPHFFWRNIAGIWFWSSMHFPKYSWSSVQPVE